MLLFLIFKIIGHDRIVSQVNGSDEGLREGKCFSGREIS